MGKANYSAKCEIVEIAKVKKYSLLVLLACAVALLLAGQANAAQAKTLYLYNWSQYMDPAIIKAFEDKYDVDVVSSYYGANSALFAKLRAGGDHQYDVIVPTDYYVPRLIKAGLIQPLNKKLIPNYDNLMGKFKDTSYDPGGKYTAAYQWGSTGIVYNTEDLPNAPQSWALIYDPSANPKLPFAMLPGGQFILGTACAYLGTGYDCVGKKQWKKAAKLVMKTKQRDNFNGFVEGTPALQLLVRGNISVGVAYSGDYLFYKNKNPKAFKTLKYFVPKEGSQLWVDVMAIPSHAPHPKLANKFINFILDAKIGAQLSNWNMYASPNKAARPYLNEALAKPPILPSEETMQQLEFTPVLEGKQLQIVQQLWTAVLSR